MPDDYTGGRRRFCVSQVIHEKMESSNGGAHTAPARHTSLQLVNALAHRALEKRHTTKDLARSLVIHVSHWYRIRKNTTILAQCERAVLERIAAYVEWPLGHVYVAAGILRIEDFESVISCDMTTQVALAQLARSPFGARLSTPIEEAASDHRQLMAALYIELQAAAVAASSPAAASHPV